MAFFTTTVLLLMTILALHCNSNVAQLVSPLESTSNNFFERHLHPAIVDETSTENVVYSPASIRYGLALIYMAAGGRTAKEMHKYLKLGNENKTAFASEYGNFLKTEFKKTKPADNEAQIFMASRLFVSDTVKIVEQFNKTAKENFDCLMERVNFNHSFAVLEKMNRWVNELPGHKIRNLLTLDVGTVCMLTNAIYFEANWLHAFPKHFTTKHKFHLSSEEKTEVDTMTVDGEFGYASISHLDATALELPYENSSTSMLIILPNKIHGLKKLEKKLKKIDLNDITAEMVPTNVRVLLPKFRIESNIDLKEPLEKMGFSFLFSRKAKLSAIFKHDNSESVSAVKHRAFFECNEDGTETAVVGNRKLSKSFGHSHLIFHANRPFIFFVRSKTSVLFAGRVIKL